jgi:hypothetical protein
MKRLFIGGTAAAFVIAAASAAAAQVAPPPGVAQGTMTAPVPPVSPMERQHVMIMTNKVMTRNEVVDHVRKMFGHLDANRDGYITREEVQSIHTSMMGMHGGAMPKQFVLHDGQMADRGGMPARGAIFDRLDTNHDQYISRQEFTAGQPLREERVFIMRSGAPGAMRMGGTGMGMAEGMHGGFGGHMFEMADANHDGRVSLAEAQAAALAHFDRADLNHDGRLTPEERQQSHQMMRMQRRPG